MASAGMQIGKYELLGNQPLGAGGMAEVWRARHQLTQREVAIKLLHRQLSQNPKIVQQFVQEAQVGARIGRHPSIIEVFDAGFDEATGLAYLVMELLEGRSLDAFLEERGPLDWALAARLFRSLGDAIDTAHRQGVIHRDLKPSNLFITLSHEGFPLLKVLDFGIARVKENEAARTATQIGTPAYAAPEQLGPVFRELAAKEGIEIPMDVTPATDVWALGLVAYDALTGHEGGQLWGVTSAAELPLVVTTRPTPKPSDRASVRLPPGFDEWFSRCVERDGRKRRGDAMGAMSELANLLEAASGAQDPASNAGAGAAPVAPLPAPPKPNSETSPVAQATKALDAPPAAELFESPPQAAASNAEAAPKSLDVSELNLRPKRPWLPFAIGGGGVVLLLAIIAIAGGIGASSLHTELETQHSELMACLLGPQPVKADEVEGQLKVYAAKLFIEEDTEEWPKRCISHAARLQDRIVTEAGNDRKLGAYAMVLKEATGAMIDTGSNPFEVPAKIPLDILEAADKAGLVWRATAEEENGTERLLQPLLDESAFTEENRLSTTEISWDSIQHELHWHPDLAFLIDDSHNKRVLLCRAGRKSFDCGRVADSVIREGGVVRLEATRAPGAEPLLVGSGQGSTGIFRANGDAILKGEKFGWATSLGKGKWLTLSYRNEYDRPNIDRLKLRSSEDQVGIIIDKPKEIGENNIYYTVFLGPGWVLWQGRAEDDEIYVWQQEIRTNPLALGTLERRAKVGFYDTDIDYNWRLCDARAPAEHGKPMTGGLVFAEERLVPIVGGNLGGGALEGHFANDSIRCDGPGISFAHDNGGKVCVGMSCKVRPSLSDRHVLSEASGADLGNGIVSVARYGLPYLLALKNGQSKSSLAVLVNEFGPRDPQPMTGFKVYPVEGGALLLARSERGTHVFRIEVADAANSDFPVTVKPLPVTM